MAKQSKKEISKVNWAQWTDGQTSDAEIQTGAIQRIADAVERMASPYVTLLQDKEYYRVRCEELERRIVERDRTISNLRGQITKIKNKLVADCAK
jgi:uncharacterized coiled-coil DUF342 family protein